MTTTTNARIDDAASGLSRMAAFEDEAMPHHKDLFRTAVRMLQNQEKAGDAVQETYLLAWRSFDKYQAGTNCRAWLFQILFNVVRHERRNWFKWITGKEEDLSQTALAAPPAVPDKLTDAAILAALERIPESYRAVVLLTDVEEFSYKEASQILNIPIGTVMSRLSRGRALMREELREVAQSYGVLRTKVAEA